MTLKPRIVSASPFRCKVWDLHHRLDHVIDENTCNAEICSFSEHGQLVAALGRPLHGDPDHDIELICGARRLFIARHLNVPLRVEVREMTNRAALIAMDIENRQRVDLSPYERGLSFARCLRAGYFESQEDLARALRISQSQVSRLLTLARLPSIVVSAFPNPMEIREGWGFDIDRALQDTRRRQATIARARALVSSTPRPSAVDVYQQLLAATVAGRKVRTKSRDEVVTDDDGMPLFRIRARAKTIAVLLPRDQISQDALDAVRDAVRDVLRYKSRPTVVRQHPTRKLYRGFKPGGVERPSTAASSALVNLTERQQAAQPGDSEC
jgi:ParB family chromosome partitioning protein